MAEGGGSRAAVPGEAGGEMKYEYHEPEPARVEYRAVEKSTGKVLMWYWAPGASQLTGIEIKGYPRDTYRLEVHPITPNEETAR